MAATTPKPSPTRSPAEGCPSNPPPIVPKIVPIATSDPPPRMFRRSMALPYALARFAATINDAFTMAVREVASGSRPWGRMIHFYLEDTRALDDVTDLMRTFGRHAPSEAAARAGASRVAGNLTRFCHWRQVERAIVMLSDEDVTGTVH